MTSFAKLLYKAFLTITVATAPAVGETVQIPGPAGPLEGEILRAHNALQWVIIIPGSGPIDRNGNSEELGLNSDTYALLAQEYLSIGLTSLRIDKRGFFGSRLAISDPAEVSLTGYAQDVTQWSEHAREQGAECVWLAGHSEGGLVALIVAEANPDFLCGLILLAAPSQEFDQIALDQIRQNPQTRLHVDEAEAILSDLRNGVVRAPSDITPILRPYFAEGNQRWIIQLLSFDPIALAQAYSGPTLVVQGTADHLVSEENAFRLSSELENSEVLSLPNATHTLKSRVPGQPFATFTDPQLPLHPDLGPGLEAFFLSTR